MQSSMTETTTRSSENMSDKQKVREGHNDTNTKAKPSRTDGQGRRITPRH